MIGKVLRKKDYSASDFQKTILTVTVSNKFWKDFGVGPFWVLFLDSLHGAGLGAEQRDQGGLAGRALDDAARLAARPRQEALRQTEHLAQPIQHHDLQFSARGTSDLENSIIYTLILYQSFDA